MGIKVEMPGHASVFVLDLHTNSSVSSVENYCSSDQLSLSSYMNH